MILISRGVDEWVQIGQEAILVAPTDIDRKGVRLIARGRMIGGPDDGGTFTRTADLGKGGELRLGPHVIVVVVEVRGDFVRLGVHAPPHLSIQRKEVADALKRAQRPEG
ncbi:MAG TPA: carbon storage regulator [Tepidisphaeraceae bacterium]|nr:carbon storage regulator [Tepidisphaeraceae bacterium]